jgi:probable rRNA maturation factor
VVSATGENEWPLPSTRTRSALATSSCTCSTEVGLWNRAAVKVTLPAQFRIMAPFCPAERAPHGAFSILGSVSIEVSNESGVPVDAELVVSVARHALAALRVSPAAELSIIAVTTDTMAELHERWMDEPGPTDVMSFPMDELVEESRRPDASDMGPALLGDIVLCPEFAKAQARSAGHSLDDELHLLTVHGVLHLLGYDHAEPDEEREMFALQATLLADWRRARSAAAARAAQRRSDSAVLGTVGLDDT